MKKRFPILMASAALVMTGMISGARAEEGPDTKMPKEPKVTVSGYISDSMCGLDHSEMMKKHGGKAEFDEAACVAACVKGGAKYVLADPESHKTYAIKDQGKVAKFAGKTVQIEGKLEEDGTTLEVEKVTLKP